MPPRLGSPSRSRSNGRKHVHVVASARLNFSVQDRRLNTRLLHETQRRKAQLLGLTTDDVAHQHHRYTVAPSTVMDEAHTRGSAASSIQSSSGGVEGGAEGGLGTAGFPGGAAATEAGSPAVSSGRDAYSRWQAQYAQHLNTKTQSGAAPDPAVAGTAAPAVAPYAGVTSGATVARSGQTLAAPQTPSYEAWLAAGCPTGSWRTLLLEELYAPVEAEQAFLAAKYDPRGRPPTQ